MKKTRLESRVAQLIKRHDLIPQGETVVVAVSGGADSVCLLYSLARLRGEMSTRLHVAHLNHQLRGHESDAEAQYVADLARSLDLPFTIASQDVAAHRTSRGCSLEEAAREVRYAFLAGVAREVGASRVAAGHTRDDQVETILMHILRGAGTAGLSGLASCTPLAYDADILPFRGTLHGRKGGPQAESPVPIVGGPGAESPVPIVQGLGTQPPVRLLLIRPLLEITREETTLYCRQHGLEPCEDSSNRSPLFLRNRLRLELLPLLRQYNPSIDRALLRLADIAGEDDAFIEAQAAALWQSVARQEDDVIHLDRQQLLALHVALQRRLVRTALAELVGDPRDIEAVHVEAALSLLSKPVGKEVHLPHGLVCRAGYDELVVTREPPAGSEPPGVIAPQSHCESRHVGTKHFRASARGSSPPHSSSPESLGIFVPDVVGIFVLPPGERGQGRENRIDSPLPRWERTKVRVTPDEAAGMGQEAAGSSPPHSNSPESLGIFVLPPGERGQGGENRIDSPLPRWERIKVRVIPDEAAGETPGAPCLLPPLSGEVQLQVPGETFLPGWRVTASIVRREEDACHCDRSEEPHLARRSDPFVAYLDLAEAGTQFMVRQRQPGDRFQPLGMSTTKKLQDFMVDARIPRARRDHIPVVCSPQHILWVVGWRIDDRVKVTEATEQVLRLEFARWE